MNHSDLFYDDLPEDPEQAFLFLKSKFRTECDAQLKESMHSPVAADSIYVQYVSRVMGAITEFGLKCELKRPPIKSNVMFYPQYLEFRRDVDEYRTILSIRNSRRRKEYTVALDQPTKIKLRHLLSQIKEAVDKLYVSPSKKESLFSKIEALENEINRDRTRLEVIADFWITGCEAFGAGVENLEPLRKWVDSIGSLLGRAKSEEKDATRHLPSPEPQKQIEPPKPKED